MSFSRQMVSNDRNFLLRNAKNQKIKDKKLSIVKILELIFEKVRPENWIFKLQRTVINKKWVVVLTYFAHSSSKCPFESNMYFEFPMQLYCIKTFKRSLLTTSMILYVERMRGYELKLQVIKPLNQYPCEKSNPEKII